MKGQYFTLGDLFRADVRTSRQADEINTRLQSALGFDYRYQVARLAIALSLGDPSEPPPATDFLGKPIRGETLFGQEEVDVALWTALIVQHAAETPGSRKHVLELAGAHWQRGIQRLQRRWSKYNGSAPDFLCVLGSVDATV